MGKQTCLLDELQSVLEEQIRLARQGNPPQRIELLGEQANSLVEKIDEAGLFESNEFRNRREHLTKLYGDLYLALTVQKDEASKELMKVRNSRKALKAYRNNT